MYSEMLLLTIRFRLLFLLLPQSTWSRIQFARNCIGHHESAGNQTNARRDATKPKVGRYQSTLEKFDPTNIHGQVGVVVLMSSVFAPAPIQSRTAA